MSTQYISESGLHHQLNMFTCSMNSLGRQRGRFNIFYQNLIPTIGWTMEQLGPLEGNSYTCNVCVILSNGNEKVRVVW